MFVDFITLESLDAKSILTDTLINQVGIYLQRAKFLGTDLLLVFLRFGFKV